MPSVSLPSIHEMFPEHLMFTLPSQSFDGTSPALNISRSPSCPLRTSREAKAAPANVEDSVHCTLNVLRSEPPSASLQHITYSAAHDSLNGLSVNSQYESQTPPTSGLKIASFSSCEHLSVDADEKRYICSTCYKRFSRPSSLRIHTNTHTGATPFQCPFPNCGRKFSVNSNMRRHYRNHIPPSLRAKAQSEKQKRQLDILILRPELLIHSPAAPYHTHPDAVHTTSQGSSPNQGDSSDSDDDSSMDADPPGPSSPHLYA
ncbi:hypothetical protein D9758_014373 [Tetrapyrgos nigripes]|uniref:C2H2-type domain-containing protein n=1 Tax=Tetrapyrgos nigripes TaxID=182062 RepID=A0A8H5CQQ0_9AGAR|nr:hypothetical protein D9758_014373 [Tetrapyrgos nigripes]